MRSYKGTSARGSAPPIRRMIMTDFTTFQVFCTEDKFWAMHDCFSDVCERNEDFSENEREVRTFNVSFTHNYVTFSVDTNDAFSMEFAAHMMRSWRN